VSTAPSLPARTLLVVVAGLLTAACGDGRTPVLRDLRFDGQAPDSPLVILLSVGFEDPDGDLGDGHLLTLINGTPTSAGQLPLLPIFISSGVDDRATSGRLDFVLELSFADRPPPAGSAFTLGARATDGDNNTSGTQEIRLRLDYE
jgi:hypothetical protein